MITLIDIAVLLIAIVVCIILLKVLKVVTRVIINSIVGLILLFIASFAGFSVDINLLTILICALAGIPGALLVIILGLLGIQIQL